MNIKMTAKRYASYGLSIFPVYPADHPTKPKKPLFSWKQFQCRIATPEEIGSFFPYKKPLSVAMVSGSVSGNLEVLDFDKPELFPVFMERLRDRLRELAERLIIQNSPSGGFHLIYRCTAPVSGNQKLAMSQRYHDEAGNPRQDVFIETRGEGGYFLVAPSKGYALQGDLENIPTITDQERAILINLAKGFDETQEPERQQPKSTPTELTGDRPGDIFERAADWRQLLEADGWKYLKIIGDREHWSRPGKDPASSSATLNEKGLYVFSSNTPLPTETPLGKFSYLANFRFSGDFKAAARYVIDTYPEYFKNEGQNRLINTQHIKKIGIDSDNSDNSVFPDKSDGFRRNTTDSETLRQLSTKSDNEYGRKRNITQYVYDFIDQDPAPFSNNDVYSELCARSREEKKKICDTLLYCEKQGKIKKIDGKRGSWEVVESAPQVMDLLSVDDHPFNVSLPLEISEFVIVRPGGIILISGSNNAGKTVFLLSICRNFFGPHINGNRLTPLSNEREEVCQKIHYLNSEMSRQELVARIRSFGDDPAEWVKHVSFIERTHSFDRVVAPGGINLIDFLEVNEDFFQAGKLIADIHKKLKSGIAIIAMQKKQGYAFAKGGEMTLEKPRLAINLDKNEPHGFTCKITKAKEAVDFTRNIQGMTRDFVITGDSRILPISDWRHVNEKQRAAINAEYDRNHLPRRVLETGQHYKVV